MDAATVATRRIAAEGSAADRRVTAAIENSAALTTGGGRRIAAEGAIGDCRDGSSYAA